MNTAERGGDRRYPVFHTGLVSDIDDARQAGIAEVRFECLQLFFVAIEPGDPRAGHGELLAGREPQSRGRAGHYGNLAMKLHEIILVVYYLLRMVTHATASSIPCSPPPFSAIAIRAPSTWRAPAS
ncbi:MAG: hypothetical protein JSV48_08555 [Bradyrhizobium sp.]|nr:MAG: hypothetical protein JSV48_08555 [Bradyrhizobium sp.]